ncbi:MAG: hypothetical protein ACRDND_05505 [Streptosporangiaceae bacterium]
MRTIFDGLVEELRAWHLFEQQAGNPPRRELAELPGPGRPGYGGSRGPDYGAPEPGTPEFGRIEYGHDGYYDRAPRYGWDLDAGAARPDGPR